MGSICGDRDRFPPYKISLGLRYLLLAHGRLKCHTADASAPGPSLSQLELPLFRMIQVCPKDAPTARRQAEDAVSWDSVGAAFPGGEASCGDLKRREFITVLGGATATEVAKAKLTQRIMRTSNILPIRGRLRQFLYPPFAFVIAIKSVGGLPAMTEIIRIKSTKPDVFERFPSVLYYLRYPNLFQRFPWRSAAAGDQPATAAALGNYVATVVIIEITEAEIL